MTITTYTIRTFSHLKSVITEFEQRKLEVEQTKVDHCVAQESNFSKYGKNDKLFTCNCPVDKQTFQMLTQRNSFPFKNPLDFPTPYFLHTHTAHMTDITICLPTTKHTNTTFNCFFMKVKGNVPMPEMFLPLKLGTVNVEFKNMPFMVTKHVHLHCQFEADDYKERRSNGSLKVHLQGSHKKDMLHSCP